MLNTSRGLSEQEEFWTGDFGNEYIYRNSLDRLLGPATAMWAQILQYCLEPPRSAFEMGCNIGANLYALKNLLPAKQRIWQRIHRQQYITVQSMILNILLIPLI